MLNDGIDYINVRSCVVPCGSNHYYLQVGDDCFLVESSAITKDILKMALKEATRIVFSHKITEVNIV